MKRRRNFLGNIASPARASAPDATLAPADPASAPSSQLASRSLFSGSCAIRKPETLRGFPMKRRRNFLGNIASPTEPQPPMLPSRPPIQLPLRRHRWLRSRSSAAAARPVSPKLRIVRSLLLLGAVAVILLVGWGALRIGAGLPFFLVDHVSVTGPSYLSHEAVRELAGVNNSSSVWDPQEIWIDNLTAHPLINSAKVSRRLPSTLVFTVQEVQPVALVASPLVVPVDAHGQPLPIDPTQPVLDLPLISVHSPQPTDPNSKIGILAQEVARVREMAPEVFSVISEAQLEGRLVTLLLGDTALRIRYPAPVTEERLREAVVAMNDALERFPDRPLQEIDLRFEDQVVVRTATVSRNQAVAAL